MSTPQPAAMKHASSQQGRTPSQLAVATPPVSTPFSNPATTAGFTPRGPRSSPQHLKKSPAASTLAGQTAQNAPVNFDSPSTAAAMRALDMGTGFGFGLDNVGLGSLDAMPGFSSDDDKVKRLDLILKTLETKGFVSQAGIARLAQRSGLELLSEESIAADGRKTQTLVIAGSLLALDIVLDNNIVQSLTLAFHESPPLVQRHAEAASKILLSNLQLRPNQSPLTKTLDDFAVNFERLALLDKLSTTPGLNCQEALVGIYVSLERLYSHDMSQIKKESDMTAKSDDYLSQVVTCTRHGRPVMHANNRVGLALQYWKDQRLAKPQSPAEVASARGRFWSLLIGCAAIIGVGLPPVRVSENWITEAVVKEDASGEGKTAALDWQQPDNIILPQNEDTKDSSMEVIQSDLSSARVPRVMFVATFDPPLILPQNEWVQIYTHLNVDPPDLGMPNEFGRPPPPTYDSLFFPVSPGTKSDPSDTRTIQRQRDVEIVDQEGNSSQKRHVNRLFVYKPIYGQVITEVPFSHPRQLVELLPTLRQYAFLSTLLESSFGSKTTIEVDASKAEQVSGTTTTQSTTTSEQLNAFLDGDARQPDASAASARQITPQKGMMDVILSVHPSPQLQVVMPFRKTSTANITLRIMPGGTVQILNENVIAQVSEEVKRKFRNLTADKLGEALEHFEDLCSWAEWIQSRLG